MTVLYSEPETLLSAVAEDDRSTVEWKIRSARTTQKGLQGVREILLGRQTTCQLSKLAAYLAVRIILLTCGTGLRGVFGQIAPSVQRKYMETRYGEDDKGGGPDPFCISAVAVTQIRFASARQLDRRVASREPRARAIEHGPFANNAPQAGRAGMHRLAEQHPKNIA